MSIKGYLLSGMLDLSVYPTEWAGYWRSPDEAITKDYSPWNLEGERGNEGDRDEARADFERSVNVRSCNVEDIPHCCDFSRSDEDVHALFLSLTVTSLVLLLYHGTPSQLHHGPVSVSNRDVTWR